MALDGGTGQVANIDALLTAFLFGGLALPHGLQCTGVAVLRKWRRFERRCSARRPSPSAAHGVELQALLHGQRPRKDAEEIHPASTLVAHLPHGFACQRLDL